MLADRERLLADEVPEEIQGGFPGLGIHLVLEDARETPVLGGFRGHLDLAGNTVGNLADKTYQLGVGVFVAKVLGDKSF